MINISHTIAHNGTLTPAIFPTRRPQAPAQFTTTGACNSQSYDVYARTKAKRLGMINVYFFAYPRN